MAADIIVVGAGLAGLVAGLVRAHRLGRHAKSRSAIPT